MTVATNRPDGWPQATTVGYVNDGLTEIHQPLAPGAKADARPVSRRHPNHRV